MKKNKAGKGTENVDMFELRQVRQVGHRTINPLGLFLRYF